ncbi:DUF6356 family protein [Bradyrhizobium sp. USDA 4486]
MQTTLHRLFLSHPQSVDESYGEHFLFALGFAARLFGAALVALVHAVIPCLFETTASRMIGQMHERIARRGHALQPAAPASP